MGSDLVGNPDFPNLVGGKLVGKEDFPNLVGAKIVGSEKLVGGVSGQANLGSNFEDIFVSKISGQCTFL